MSDSPHFCDRCLQPLVPGAGDWFLVTIEAVADPTPPTITAEELATLDPRREIERLLEQLADASPRELVDQVHRRVTLTMCRRCFAVWIEDPAGRP